jgi:hypothetical protein
MRSPRNWAEIKMVLRGFRRVQIDNPNKHKSLQWLITFTVCSFVVAARQELRIG